MKKRRSSVWVNPDLVLMMQSKGIDLSAFLNRAMELFLELPEDPHEQMIKHRTEEIVSKLLLRYAKEMKDCILEKEAREKILNAPKENLRIVGIHIKTSKHNGRLLESLENKDFDEDLWDRACTEINKKNKTKYDSLALFNQGIDWFRTFGGRSQYEKESIIA